MHTVSLSVSQATSGKTQGSHKSFILGKEMPTLARSTVFNNKLTTTLPHLQMTLTPGPYHSKVTPTKLHRHTNTE